MTNKGPQLWQAYDEKARPLVNPNDLPKEIPLDVWSFTYTYLTIEQREQWVQVANMMLYLDEMLEVESKGQYARRDAIKAMIDAHGWLK